MARLWRGRAGMAVLAFPVAFLLLALGGCELLYFAGVARNKTNVVHTFPKGQHVLILVEIRDGVSAPPTFTTNLADNIATQFWAQKVVDAPLVSQDKIITLQQTNPEAYKRMGVADIARETGADVVLRIYITQLLATPTSDGTVADGSAEAFIKLIDKNGERIWPGEVAGTQILAHQDMGLLSERPVPEIVKRLAQQLADNTARLFYPHLTTEDHGVGK